MTDFSRRAVREATFTPKNVPPPIPERYHRAPKVYSKPSLAEQLADQRRDLAQRELDRRETYRFVELVCWFAIGFVIVSLASL